MAWANDHARTSARAEVLRCAESERPTPIASARVRSYLCLLTSIVFLLELLTFELTRNEALAVLVVSAGTASGPARGFPAAGRVRLWRDLPTAEARIAGIRVLTAGVVTLLYAVGTVYV
jgi:hypothetical protein